MADFITQNLGTGIVLALLVFIVILAVRKMRKDKKEGKTCSCGNSCDGCTLKGQCHSTEEK